MPKRTANYEILESNDDYILLRDLGPWDEYPTITNSVGEVLRSLAGSLIAQKKDKLLYYIEDDGECTRIQYEINEEAVVKNQPVFKGFAFVSFYVESIYAVFPPSKWVAEGDIGVTEDLNQARTFSLRELREEGLLTYRNRNLKPKFADLVDRKAIRTANIGRMEVSLPETAS